MHSILQKLYQGESLSQEETSFAFGQLVSGKSDSVITSSLLTALKIKGESPAEVAGAALAMRNNARFFERPDFSTADSCGTGGSGQHTLNISTLVAFIAATEGIPMVKHGNRSVSSQCGSADVLEQLGVNIEMSANTARRCLDKAGITFLFAPAYHPGVKHVMPVRKALATRTIFNLIGPLANPAAPEFQLMGVYSPDYCSVAAESLKLSGTKAAMVVHSQGCDEITLAGNTRVAELRDGKINEYELSPSDFGLKKASLDFLKGGSPIDNAREFQAVLQGKASTAVMETVAANTAALIYLCGRADSLPAATERALAIMQSGNAMATLDALIEQSRVVESLSAVKQAVVAGAN